MRRGTWGGDDLDAIYRVSRSGVIRTAELARLGVSNSAVHTRCRVGGPWQRILPGVILLRNGQPTPRQRSIAALMLSGDDSLLTGRSAMSEYGYRTHSGGMCRCSSPSTVEFNRLGSSRWSALFDCPSRRFGTVCAVLRCRERYSTLRGGTRRSIPHGHSSLRLFSAAMSRCANLRRNSKRVAVGGVPRYLGSCCAK